jgi:DNA-directed RNA polymerase specialized sigma24 family protein
VIIFRDVEELSIDEISAMLAVSREAVKARLNRARKLVREFVGR